MQAEPVPVLGEAGGVPRGGERGPRPGRLRPLREPVPQEPLQAEQILVSIQQMHIILKV